MLPTTNEAGWPGRRLPEENWTAKTPLLRLAVADGVSTNPMKECADKVDEELKPVRVITILPPTTDTTENGVKEIVTDVWVAALEMLRLT